MTPVVCLVTDRRRAGADWARALPALAGAAARAGVDLIQVREPDLEGGVLAALVAGCLDAVRGTRARVVVNDRADVALAAGADGVHLPAAGAPAVRVRRLGPPGWLVGRSVHSAGEARAAVAAGGVDYLLLGTVFPTVSKPGRAPCGPDELARAVRAVPIPVLAIGGITPDRAREVAEAGAAGFAAIGLFAGPAAGPGDTLPAMRRMFDTPQALS